LEGAIESMHREEKTGAAGAPTILPASTAIDLECRSHVDTMTAALWLNRTPQTLRKWACYEIGPVRAIRPGGRLMWPVDEILTLLNRR
jgi:hypothetical protein